MCCVYNLRIPCRTALPVPFPPPEFLYCSKSGSRKGRGKQQECSGTPEQHRRSLTDRVNADKKANSKVAIEQPLCAVIAICCLCAGTALHRIKENQQLGKQQTRKYGMKRVILPQVTKFCRIAHNPYPFLRTAGSRRQNVPPFPAAAPSSPW